MWLWLVLPRRSLSPAAQAIKPQLTNLTNSDTNFRLTELLLKESLDDGFLQRGSEHISRIRCRENSGKRDVRSSSVQPTFQGGKSFQQSRRTSSLPPRNSSVTRNFTADTQFFRNPYEDDAPAITMYTDGSCVGNAAGIGVFFGVNHSLNISQRCGPPYNSGYAEITAAIEGLRALINWPQYNSENVKVCTDYLPLITSLLFPSPNHRFAEEIIGLRRTAQDFPRGVLFEHVYAHSDNFGNEEADALARRAVGLGRSRSRSRCRSRSRSCNSSRSLSIYRPESGMEERPRVAYVPPLVPFSVHRKSESDRDKDSSGYSSNSSNELPIDFTQSSDLQRPSRSRAIRTTANSSKRDERPPSNSS